MGLVGIAIFVGDIRQFFVVTFFQLFNGRVKSANLGKQIWA
jgi:hypothetical protein